MEFEIELVFVGCASEAELPKFCLPYHDSILSKLIVNHGMKHHHSSRLCWLGH